MIKIVFKLNKQKGFDEDNLFTYSDRGVNVEVGDIVVANTRYGLALGKVVEVNINDERYQEENLATIFKVILTNKEIEEAEEQRKIRENRVKMILENAKKTKIMRELNELLPDEDLKDLTIEELNEIYRSL